MYIKISPLLINSYIQYNHLLPKYHVLWDGTETLTLYSQQDDKSEEI
jgi:hypothetical protein